MKSPAELNSPHQNSPATTPDQTRHRTTRKRAPHAKPNSPPRDNSPAAANLQTDFRKLGKPGKCLKPCLKPSAEPPAKMNILLILTKNSSNTEIEPRSAPPHTKTRSSPKYHANHCSTRLQPDGNRQTRRHMPQPHQPNPPGGAQGTRPHCLERGAPREER